MYDAVFVLVEAFNKILRKKPDQFRNNVQRRSQTLMVAQAAASTSSDGYNYNASGGGSSGFGNGGAGGGFAGSDSGGSGGMASRALDCNTAKGWVNAWEHGDKISRYLRKVSLGSIHVRDDEMMWTQCTDIIDIDTPAMPAWQTDKAIKHTLLFLFYGSLCTLYPVSCILYGVYIYLLVSLPPQVEIEGLTGDIKFNDDGRRVNYTLHVVEMTVNSAMVCVLLSSVV